ncbi:uncharacterized protein TEOVI_000791600 [Trypanosoma equiperdum]|uniref:Uncharacterized protein n=2 Tax=Trypanozoon TaxID=39700 RepID=Q38F61_TRYB2|nr:hypothetical protein, unlikely [Trypanosoma brucei brucei TREU927]EAN76559.1 hypothetical protein, unlikely [Trypanosoma brucei brucei TREU927]SCU68330.1 hypothetical protein, conserved [Trypanosoma equiperdum]
MNAQQCMHNMYEPRKKQHEIKAPAQPHNCKGLNHSSGATNLTEQPNKLVFNYPKRGSANDSEGKGYDGTELLYVTWFHSGTDHADTLKHLGKKDVFHVSYRYSTLKRRTSNTPSSSRSTQLKSPRAE